MESLVFFKVTAGILVAVFLYYGMDVRRKPGARHFVAPFWQLLMKLSSFTLIAAFVWIAWSVRQLSPIDWLSLVALAGGTAFIVAAKRALGAVHTFTGQYLEKPGLVVRSINIVTQ